ncbi:MAG: hypothetical protein RIF33_00200 [Cyclobacteriaceae bacterium]
MVRSKAWLETYLKQPIPESPRKSRYFELINEVSGDYCDVDVSFFTGTDQHESPSRRKISALGNLAFSYHTPGLIYHKDPTALSMLRDSFVGMTSHVSDEGKFTWENDKLSYRHGSHEHGWRLEPLLMGYIWIKEDLSEGDQEIIEDALWKAGRWLFENPNTENNNRGIVSSAVLASAGLYFEEPTWFNRAQDLGDDIFKAVILPNGQIGEHTEQYAGGGPDINYTYTGLGYLYTYRLFTGAEHLDPLIKKAAHWLTGYNTVSQWPVVVGASVRTTRANSSSYRDCLPLFERMSKVDPYYGFISDMALEKVGGLGYNPFDPGRCHIISPAIWALLEGGKGGDAGARDHVNRTEVYNNPNVDYALVTRDYQTGIVFRARSGYKNNSQELYRKLPAEGMPLRGMQTWAWQDELPIILHDDGGAEGRHSYTSAGDFNSATTDVDRWEEIVNADSTMHTIVEWRGPFWTLYAFTESSTVVAYGGPERDYTTKWYMNPDIVPRHSIDADKNTISFEGLAGKIIYRTGQATSKEGGVEIITDAENMAFGFSDNNFSFNQRSEPANRLTFTDMSGSYELDFDMLLKSRN